MLPRILRGSLTTWLVALLLVSSQGCLHAGDRKDDLGPGIGKEGMISVQRGKAKTIAELAAMYDSSSCIECHSDIHEDWQKSPHSKPLFGTGRTAATFKTAMENGFMSWAYSGVQGVEDITVAHLQGCTKCHLPQLADATDDVAREIATSINTWYSAVREGNEDVRAVEEKKLLSLNINCLICHNRNAITHKWTDGYPQDGVVYGSQDGEHDDAHFTKMATSPIMDAAIICGQCHGLGPNLELDNPTQCATAYGSYLWAYRGEVGQETCQDCHMRKSGLGHKILSYSDEGMAKAAVDFEVETYGSNWRDGSYYTPKAVVKVKMTNKAGHSIPDG